MIPNHFGLGDYKCDIALLDVMKPIHKYLKRYKLIEFYLLDNTELSALLILPALVPDNRSKVDISKVVYIAQVIFMQHIIVIM